MVPDTNCLLITTTKRVGPLIIERRKEKNRANSGSKLRQTR